MTNKSYLPASSRLPVQQIRGGAMNLDRAHKSMLVLLAHVLAQRTGKQDLAGK